MQAAQQQQLLDALKLAQTLHPSGGGLGSGSLLLNHQGADLALLGQLQLLGSAGLALGGLQPAEEPMQDARGRGKAARSTDSRSSSAYASRHQAAEQRRRTRINER